MLDVNRENELKMREEFSNGILNNVAGAIGFIEYIKWNKIRIVINMEPKPSQRPRLSGYRVYVPGAYKNTAFFHKNVLPTLKGIWIDTPCKTKLDIYVKTPESFTKTQKLLAEMRILRPWAHIGDIDNYEKSVYDAIQGNQKRGHNGIMSDDSLIIESHSNKYYSISPRYEIEISYMKEIPEQIKSVLKLRK